MTLIRFIKYLSLRFHVGSLYDKYNSLEGMEKTAFLMENFGVNWNETKEELEFDERQFQNSQH